MCKWDVSMAVHVLLVSNGLILTFGCLLAVVGGIVLAFDKGAIDAVYTTYWTRYFLIGLGVLASSYALLGVTISKRTFWNRVFSNPTSASSPSFGGSFRPNRRADEGAARSCRACWTYVYLFITCFLLLTQLFVLSIGMQYVANVKVPGMKTLGGSMMKEVDKAIAVAVEENPKMWMELQNAMHCCGYNSTADKTATGSLCKDLVDVQTDTEANNVTNSPTRSPSFRPTLTVPAFVQFLILVEGKKLQEIDEASVQFILYQSTPAFFKYNIPQHSIQLGVPVDSPRANASTTVISVKISGIDRNLAQTLPVELQASESLLLASNTLEDYFEFTYSFSLTVKMVDFTSSTLPPSLSPTPKPTGKIPFGWPTPKPSVEGSASLGPTVSPTKSTSNPTLGTTALTSTPSLSPSLTPTSSTASPSRSTINPTAPSSMPTSITQAPTNSTAGPTGDTTSPSTTTNAPTTSTKSPTASPTQVPTTMTVSPSTSPSVRNDSSTPSSSPTTFTEGPSLSPSTSPSLTPTSRTLAPTSATETPTGNTKTPTTSTVSPTNPTAAPTTVTEGPTLTTTAPTDNTMSPTVSPTTSNPSTTAPSSSPSEPPTTLSPTLPTRSPTSRRTPRSASPTFSLPALDDDMVSKVSGVLERRIIDNFEEQPGDTIGALLRLAFHDAGTFTKQPIPSLSSDFRWGARACMFNKCDVATKACELNSEDFGLEEIIFFLEDILVNETVQSGESTLPIERVISRPDLWHLAVKVVLEMKSHTDWIPYDWKWGRTNCPIDLKEYRSLPLHPFLGFHGLEAFFEKTLNFTKPEWIALMGAHTVGRAEKENSGFDGKWTKNPDVFDNEYFMDLVGVPWQRVDLANEGIAAFQPFRFDDTSANTIMLPVDIAIGWNHSSPAKCSVRISQPRCKIEFDGLFQAMDFSQNRPLFYGSFSRAMKKLSEFTVDELFEVATNPVAEGTKSNDQLFVETCRDAAINQMKGEAMVLINVACVNSVLLSLCLVAVVRLMCGLGQAEEDFRNRSQIMKENPRTSYDDELELPPL